EAEAGGMQGLAGKGEGGLPGGRYETIAPRGCRPSIDRIANQPKAKRRQMHPDLMGAARFQSTLHQGGTVAKRFQYLVMCHGMLTAAFQHRHLFPVMAVAADIALDPSFTRLRDTPGDALIAALDIVPGEGSRQGLMRLIVLGDHH